MILWHEHRHPVIDRWCGEYWPDDSDTGAPWGVCWVVDYSRTIGPVLCYVLVADQYRRQGIATRLIQDARERFPGLHLTEGVTPCGEALYKFLKEGQ